MSLHIQIKKAATFIYHAIAVYGPGTNMPFKYHMSHMQISAYTDMRQLCQYICLIRTQCNQQCHQELWHTYI